MSKPKTKTETKPKLTLLQEGFIQAYLGAAQGNATEACRIAGYKGNNNTLSRQGHDNLQLPKVAQAIQQEKAIQRAQTDMDLDWWREQQRKVLDMSLADGDRANANTALRSLGMHLGAYEAGQGRTGSAPTIVIHMPDLPQGQAQPLLEAEVVDEQDSA